MAANLLQVDIISPEKPLYSGPASAVVAPAYDGEMGILPHHAPMVTAVGIGEVRITTDAGVDYFAVSGGFLQTSGGKVILITEDAKSPDEINDTKVAARLAEVEKQLAGSLRGEERAAVTNERRWLETQAKVATKSRKGAERIGAMAKAGIAVAVDKA